MAYQPHALVEDLLDVCQREEADPWPLSEDPTPHLPSHRFRLHDGARKDLEAIPGSDSNGQFASPGAAKWDSTNVLGDIYRTLGKVLARSVTRFQEPRVTPAEKARHFLLSLASLPIAASASPQPSVSQHMPSKIAPFAQPEKAAYKKGSPGGT